MFELSRLNVHRIVASEEEKAKLLAMGYKEVTREEFLGEFTEMPLGGAKEDPPADNSEGKGKEKA